MVSDLEVPNEVRWKKHHLMGCSWTDRLKAGRSWSHMDSKISDIGVREIADDDSVWCEVMAWWTEVEWRLRSGGDEEPRGVDYGSWNCGS